MTIATSELASTASPDALPDPSRTARNAAPRQLPRLEECPARLSAEHIAQFNRDGYLAFDNLLTPLEVAAIKSAMSDIVRRTVAAVREGKGYVKQADWMSMKNYSGTRAGANDGRTHIQFEPDAKIDLALATTEEIEHNLRKISDPCDGHPILSLLPAHPRLRPLLESLLGPGPLPYNSMGLMKPARIGVAKPWHQDAAYFDYLPADAGVDVWIALDDALIENGCMYVLPGGHKSGALKHIHTDDCEIAPGRMDQSQGVPVEMRSGAALLFSVLTPHYTPPNKSDLHRWSLQLFYRGANTRLVSREEHAAKYLEADGTPATCFSAGLERKQGMTGDKE